MSTGGFITVTAGIHTGASVQLSDGQDMTIGNADDSSLVLVDDGIVPHHATVSLNGELLRLIAHHDGVSVFGHALLPGKPTLLRRGASFTVGNAQMQFSGRHPLTPDTLRAAELAWLFAHAPLAYIPRRWALMSRGMKLTLTMLVLSVGAAAAWQAFAPHEPERAQLKLDGAFSHVSVRQDAKTQAYIYEGYVRSSSDLASLSAMVRRDMCTAVIRVAVVDQIQEQLADFLQKYYRGAEIKASAPGSFTVVPPMADGYLLPESWDYRGIARLASRSIKGLNELAFEGHALTDGPVQAPLSAIGMNLAGAGNGAWLVDEKGVRYFPGAQLPFGKVMKISGCMATIERNDDGVEYQFLARDADGTTQCD